VLSSLIDKPIGTLITSEENIMEQAVISGIAHNKDEAKLSLIGVPDEPGIAYKILKPISDDNTLKGTLYYDANSTLRICNTLEPSDAISSISS
jgi:aspartokinase